MTGGRVAVLGRTGRNFGAGMSGGVAYVYNYGGDFESRCNKELILLEEMTRDKDIAELKTMIENHVKYTGSERGKEILDNFDEELKNFIKVIPKAYKEMIEEIDRAKAAGLNDDDALLDAFITVSGSAIVKRPETAVKSERSAVNG